MKTLPCSVLLLGLLAGSAHAQAYTGQQLLADCRIAETQPDVTKISDPQEALSSTRCTAYISGFADGYAVSDYLAEKVGVKLNPLWPPRDPDLLQRMIRAVVIHVERTPPQNTVSTATLVAGALGKTFPCTETLERKP